MGKRKIRMEPFGKTVQRRKVSEFLDANGWKIDLEKYKTEDEFWTYNKQNCLSIDISDKEMVFLGDTGDFLHCDINLYTLIGVLICYRQLPLNFKQP